MSKTDSLLLDRARGVAVGAAIGDAFGMALEFTPKRGEGAFVTEMTAGRLPAGAFTDDTEMALALAESILHRSPLDMDDLAQRFVAWLDGEPKDIGAQTYLVLRRVKGGQPWDEAVEAELRSQPESAGNGSLMRNWPLALRYWDNAPDLLIDSWRQSRVTHAHSDCLTACAFCNALIFNLLKGMPMETAFITTSSMVRTSDELWNLISTASYKDREELENTGWVRHTLQSVIWSLLNSGNFEEAVIQAANLGADADTSASITGAIAGAYYGLSGIPARWREALRGEWPLGSGIYWTEATFIELAERLVQAGEADS